MTASRAHKMYELMDAVAEQSQLSASTRLKARIASGLWLGVIRQDQAMLRSTPASKTKKGVELGVACPSCSLICAFVDHYCSRCGADISHASDPALKGIEALRADLVAAGISPGHPVILNLLEGKYSPSKSDSDRPLALLLEHLADLQRSVPCAASAQITKIIQRASTSKYAL